ncbi:MAG: N-formylglutamate amidohydrolase [Roseovarius sp.]|nr:N-formylglutamate amidohydrolase [Roseovarius sp.]
MPSTDISEMSEAVEIIDAQAAGRAVVLCEHASHHIPARYAGLGLAPGEGIGHVAWDPGARDLAMILARQLEAPMIAGRVSRLVYDCNRPPEAPSAMPEKSETVDIPGNRALGAAEREERVESIYSPFRAAVQGLLDKRRQAGLPTALITVHSFTPSWFGTPREVEIGILHDRDARLADAMLDRAATLPRRIVRRNEPYGPQDGVTHSLKLYGLANGLPNVMIEVRNDLLQTPAAQEEVAAEILSMLTPALNDCLPRVEGTSRA